MTAKKEGGKGAGLLGYQSGTHNLETLRPLQHLGSRCSLVT
jgi:hypothetical protein